MFTDEDLDVIDVKSSWKKERHLAEASVQTKDLQTEEVGVQSTKQKHKQVQTDEDIEEDIKLYDDDSPELVDFLKRTLPLVLKELEKNKRSHAFDGYDASWREESSTVKKTYTLCHKALSEQLHITSLSWNSTGSVIAAAYGRFDHEDWCTHKSALCTWNLDRRNLDVNKPDSTIDLASCLMCIAFHPKKPSIIAGGTFDGEVLVWDTSREDEMVVATSGIGDDSHREPVSKVHWVLDPESHGKKYNVVSVSSDGKMLDWQISQKKHSLKLVDGFILLTESLPRQARVKAKRGDQEMGVTAISYNCLDDTTFVIGSESGGVFRCSSQTRGTPAGREVVSSVAMASPVTFCFLPHQGPVHSVHCSPYHRNLFLSCATDKTIRVYSMLQAQPVMTLEPGAGYLYSAKWSPIRPLVFAAAAENGEVLVYDLKHSQAVPIVKLERESNKGPAYSLEFNPHETQVLASGYGDGSIQIWKLNSDLTERSAKEVESLDEIGQIAQE